MLKKMFLIVFAITVWEYRKEVSNSIFSSLLILLSYFGNFIRVSKEKIRINRSRTRRKSSESEEVIDD